MRGEERGARSDGVHVRTPAPGRGTGLLALRSSLLATLLIALACTEAPRADQRLAAGGDAGRGARHIAAFGCGSCHSIPGIPGAHGRVGPPLDDFAERMFIAGTLRNEATSLVRWIRFPQQVEPGTVMPDLGVTDAQARDIAAYLYTLGEGGLGPPHLIPAKVLPVH